MESVVRAMEIAFVGNPSILVQKTIGQFFDYDLVTFCEMKNSFIIDVLDGSCCLTTKTINTVYVYDDDDYLDVVNEIMNEIVQIY